MLFCFHCCLLGLGHTLATGELFTSHCCLRPQVTNIIEWRILWRQGSFHLRADDTSGATNILHSKYNLIRTAIHRRSRERDALTYPRGTCTPHRLPYLHISGIFFASGCRLLDKLRGSWKSWAPKKLRAFENSLENYVGIQVSKERRRMTKFEYEQAIKGIMEEEELEYVRNKYGGDWQWEGEGN